MDEAEKPCHNHRPHLQMQKRYTGAMVGPPGIT